MSWPGKSGPSRDLMRMSRTLCGFLFFWTFPAVAVQPPVEAIIAKAAADCRDQKGQFTASSKAVKQHVFKRGMRQVQLVDSSQFACSTAASLWGGSGGTVLWIVTSSGRVHELLAHAWTPVRVGVNRAIVLAVHPSQCGVVAQSCFRAVTLGDKDDLITTNGAP